MATIGNDPGGRKRILFYAPDGRRCTLRLGRVSQRFAEHAAGHVEHIVACLFSGEAVPPKTAAWIAEVVAENPTLAKRMAACGLIAQSGERVTPRLGPFLESYITGRTDAKPRTILNLRQAARSLVGYFGADRDLASITPGDAEEFRRALLERLADNTVRRHCGRCKQFFRHAVRKRLIPESPFAEMSGVNVRANRARDAFVSRETAAKVLEACPDAEWRLIFGLARWGGLRCPSEILALRWGDIDWGRDRFTVRASKTEHHEGCGVRSVPIFPELAPLLLEASEVAADGAVYCITRYRDTNANLRTQLLRIIERAGVAPWSKLFVSLRASRATELAAEFPAHVCAQWLGHSVKVAREHYLQVTEGDFQRAARIPARAPLPTSVTVPPIVPLSLENPENLRGALVSRMVEVPPAGLEPAT